MVRDAVVEELEAVNRIRRQVNQLHAEGRPDWFRGDFPKEMQDVALSYIQRQDNRRMLVCERENQIAGIAGIEYVDLPATPYCHPRHYLHITEFGVDEAQRRKGVGKELFDWLKKEAADSGYDQILLDMWEFNQGALAFYEAMGMRTMRRYLSVKIEP